MIYHIVACDTYDERVSEVLKAKVVTQDNVIDALKEEAPQCTKA